MKVITYYTENMSISGYTCVRSAEQFGFDAIGYTEVDAAYKKQHKVLQQQRGAGYWLWKPYLLYREMMQSEEGELIMYMDAGVELIDEPSWVNDVEDVWLFGNMYEHEHWCKGDVMEAIYAGPYQKQVQASVIAVRVNDKSKEVIGEWLRWCEVPGFIDDSPSETPNRAGFQEHRHDQAILTCVAYKYGIPLHYWPASYNDGQFEYPRGAYQDKYGVCFNHHRKRNEEW